MISYKSPSGFYNLQIPNDWTYEESDDNILSIYQIENGEGAIQISSFSIPKDYVMNIKNELLEFSSQSFENLSIDELSGLVKENLNSASLEVDNNGRFWLFYILFEKNKLLLITYNCEKKKETIERLLVNYIIDSIKIN